MVAAALCAVAARWSGPLLLHTAVSLGPARLSSWLGLVPRTWVVIPALFVLTLLLRGQRARWDRLRASGQPASLARIFVLPVLPMVALLAGVTWLVQAQDLLRQIIVVQPLTGPVVAHRNGHVGYSTVHGVLVPQGADV